MVEQLHTLQSIAIEDESAPSLAVSNRFVPALYELKLDINHTKPNFQGQLDILLKENDVYNVERSQTSTKFSLSLHASKLVITKAVLNTTSEVKLTVKYDRINSQVTLSSSEDVEIVDVANSKVSITYMGQINSIKTYQDKTHGLFKTNYLDSVSGKSNNYILSTHFQPHSAKLVFPLIEELHVKTPIKLTITTLSKFKVISVGKLLSNQPLEMSENSTFSFETSPPIAPSVFGFVIGDFEYLEDKYGDLPLRVYTSIGESRYAIRALKSMKKLLPILESLLDVKYPLEKLDFVSIPFLNDGAMENWGLVTVLSNQLLVDESTASPSTLRQIDQIVAHELVHQWIGNLVTFDDWKYLWLNESFATWLGNYILDVADNSHPKDKEFEKFLDQDCFYAEDKFSIPSINTYMSKIDTGLNSLTSTIFDTHAYEKGIILLRMIGNIIHVDGDPTSASEGDDYTRMLRGIGALIKKYQYKSIKAFEIWNTLNELTSIDLQSFVHSWLRYPGFPLVQVTTNDDNSKLLFEQHQCLYNLRADQVNLEDHPFHVPLFIKVIDDKGSSKVLNIIMTDRTLELDISLAQLVNINHNHSGYYRVKYSPKLIANIIENIDKVSSTDLITIINDYGKLLGSVGTTKEDLISLVQIIEAVCKRSHIDYDLLQVAMTYLETINSNLMHFSKYTEFQVWVDNLVSTLFQRIGGWDKLQSFKDSHCYDPVEMEVRNAILQIGVYRSDFQEVGKKLFKNFVNSGINKSFTPKQLATSMFNTMIYNAPQKDYKRVLEFVKNSNNSLLEHTDLTNSDLQTTAVSSLSFVHKDDLLHKTLNFVMTNIDAKMIELGLIGFQYKSSKQDKLKLFQWYKLHYDQWVLRSLRKGSDWSKQIGITVSNISKMVLGTIMQFDPELVELREKFVKDKLATLPPHGLQELLEAVQDENEEKVLIGGYYDDLVSQVLRA